MIKPFLLFTFISVALSACVQKDIKQFVVENRVDILSISPDSTGFSDLEAIGKAIGDSRTVQNRVSKRKAIFLYEGAATFC